MNKTISLVMMAFLLIGTLGFVVAAEDDDSVPAAEKVGFFANQMYKMKYAFTFDGEKKIDLALEMAEKRLAEAELLAEENPEAYEKAQERYDELVAKAEEVLKEMESENDGEDASVEYMEKIARIQNKFEMHMDHSDEIYTRALERFGANNASEEKLQRFEEFYERAINRSIEMQEKALDKRDNAALKHKALSDISDEDLEDLLERIDEDEGLIEAQERHMEQNKERLERLKEKGIENAESIRERIQERMDKYQDDDSDDETEIEVEFEDGVAKVEIEIAEVTSEFELTTSDLDVVISEIADRTGLSEDEIKAAMRVKFERDDDRRGPAPNSGDGISDGSGFSDDYGEGRGPAPNSGDGISDGSGFDDDDSDDDDSDDDDSDDDDSDDSETSNS